MFAQRKGEKGIPSVVLAEITPWALKRGAIRDHYPDPRQIGSANLPVESALLFQTTRDRSINGEEGWNTSTCDLKTNKNRFDGRNETDLSLSLSQLRETRRKCNTMTTCIPARRNSYKKPYEGWPLFSSCKAFWTFDSFVGSIE